MWLFFLLVVTIMLENVGYILLRWTFKIYNRIGT